MKLKSILSTAVCVGLLGGCATGTVTAHNTNTTRNPAQAATTPLFEITVMKDLNFGVVVSDLTYDDTQTNNGNLGLVPDGGKRSAMVYLQKGKVKKQSNLESPSCIFFVSNNVTFWDQHKIPKGTKFEVTQQSITTYTIGNAPTNNEPRDFDEDGSETLNSAQRHNAPVTLICSGINLDGVLRTIDSAEAKQAYGKLLEISASPAQ